MARLAAAREGRASRRLRHPSAPHPAPSHAKRGRTRRPNPRNLRKSISMTAHVVCLDGTGQMLSQPNPTNVALIFDVMGGVVDDGGYGSFESSLSVAGREAQLGKYLPGVGSQGPQLLKRLEQSVGAGIAEQIVRGYTFLSRRYEIGDEILIVGFSRGGRRRALPGWVRGRAGSAEQADLRHGGQGRRLPTGYRRVVPVPGGPAVPRESLQPHGRPPAGAGAAHASSGRLRRHRAHPGGRRVRHGELGRGPAHRARRLDRVRLRARRHGPAPQGPQRIFPIEALGGEQVFAIDQSVRDRWGETVTLMPAGGSDAYASTGLFFGPKPLFQRPVAGAQGVA